MASIAFGAADCDRGRTAPPLTSLILLKLANDTRVMWMLRPRGQGKCTSLLARLAALLAPPATASTLPWRPLSAWAGLAPLHPSPSPCCVGRGGAQHLNGRLRRKLPVE